MLRGSLPARPLALQASGLAFSHPFAALVRFQPKSITPCGILVYARLAPDIKFYIELLK